FADDNPFAESSELDGEGPAELASELAGESRVGQVIGSISKGVDLQTLLPGSTINVAPVDPHNPEKRSIEASWTDGAPTLANVSDHSLRIAARVYRVTGGEILELGGSETVELAPEEVLELDVPEELREPDDDATHEVQEFVILQQQPVSGDLGSLDLQFRWSSRGSQPAALEPDALPDSAVTIDAAEAEQMRASATFELQAKPTTGTEIEFFPWRRICVDYPVGVLDVGVGEDYKTTAISYWDASFNTVDIRNPNMWVFNGQFFVNPTIWSGNLNADGCVTLFTPLDDFRIHVEMAGQYTDSISGKEIKWSQKENLAYPEYDPTGYILNITNQPGFTTRTVHTPSDINANLAAQQAFALYRNSQIATGSPSANYTFMIENGSGSNAAVIGSGDVIRKYIIGHEIGHNMFDDWAHTINWPNDSYAFDGSGYPAVCQFGGLHSLTSIEFEGAAAREGAGHFYATFLYNDPSTSTAMFFYYKQMYPHFDITNPNSGFPFDYADTICGANIAANGVIQATHLGTEVDWMRAFWYYYVLGTDVVTMGDEFGDAMTDFKNGENQGPTKSLASWMVDNASEPLIWEFYSTVFGILG
ncbi:MAG: hypothetical protein ACPG4T_19730, partial [Nannocystaceae bacterium]